MKTRFLEFASTALTACLPGKIAFQKLASLAGHAAYSESQMKDGAFAAATSQVSEIKLARRDINL